MDGLLDNVVKAAKVEIEPMCDTKKLSKDMEEVVVVNSRSLSLVIQILVQVSKI